jgi:vitamin B12/bleomycin/antimicrobial peptide transport system ATP-binding/permease protein
MKAAAGLWPYGRGKFQTHANTRVFYAHQKPDLTGNYTLSEHVQYGIGQPLEHHLSSDEKERIVWALKTAGLSEFSSFIDQKQLGGKSWDSILSGGQRQKLVLARILYQKPDMIFLDEATSALDPQAKIRYFDVLKAHCSNATVMAITHDGLSPGNSGYCGHFTSEIALMGGIASKRDITRTDDLEIYSPS